MAKEKLMTKGKSGNYKGRPSGVPNKTGRDLVNDIIASYQALGGVKWLQALAKDDAKTYTALLGKVVPKDMVIEARITVEDAIRAFDRESAPI